MIGAHQKVALEFSGGKDSTALLYLARPYLSRITVIYTDTGAAFPHVREFVRKTCSKLNAELLIAHPKIDVATFTEGNGFPSDVIPAEASVAMKPYMQQNGTLQSYMQCCAEMIWKPMHAAVLETGATLVLRGSKKCDVRVGVGRHYLENGIEYDSPLWDWSDADVFAYLDAEGVKLPQHYETVTDSLDCWFCTAHLAHGGKGRMDYLRANYPDLWPETKRRLNEVARIVGEHQAKIVSVFEMARDG